MSDKNRQALILKNALEDATKRTDIMADQDGKGIYRFLGVRPISFITEELAKSLKELGYIIIPIESEIREIKNEQ